jgi:hypothetical protein
MTKHDWFFHTSLQVGDSLGTESNVDPASPAQDTLVEIEVSVSLRPSPSIEYLKADSIL